jgi:hypothetical protein
MYQVVWQDEHKIEITLSGELTVDEFRQVIHQLESLCAMYPGIHVLLDASSLQKYEIKLILDEYDFYKKYRSHLKRVALVSDKAVETFLFDKLNKFTETDFKSFDTEDIEAARAWIFPSRLP